jgi:hypothetical protein
LQEREKEGNHHEVSLVRLAVGESLHQFCSDFELSVSSKDGGGSEGILRMTELPAQKMFTKS